MTSATTPVIWFAFSSSLCLLICFMPRRLRIRAVFAPDRRSQEYLCSAYELILPTIERSVAAPQDNEIDEDQRPEAQVHSRDTQGGAL